LKGKSDELIAEIVSKVSVNLNGASNAIALDANQEEIFNVKIDDTIKNLRSTPSEIKYLILNGPVTKSLVNAAVEEGVEYLVCRQKNKMEGHGKLVIKTFREIGLP
ncbi:MAG TPA: DNA primase, partial [Candidatus Bathyarchaeia archaeon]|nr:DNA primase [Candidatus Bathyarchaeia archaeon]